MGIKHWRKSTNKTLLPLDETGLLVYRETVKKLVNIARGQTRKPAHLYNIFIRAFNTVLFKKGNSLVDSTELLNRYSTVIQDLSEENLEQQCYLFLIELWNFLQYRWKFRSRKYKTVFYDTVRSTLPRWLGRFIAKLVQSNIADQHYMNQYHISELQDSELNEIEINLKWVTLKNTYSIFKMLSVKEKYLLYLRYERGFKVKDISLMLKRNIGLLSKDYQRIFRSLKCRYQE